MPEAKQSFYDGVKGIAPILLGVIPFGLIAGIAAVSVGLTWLEAMAASMFLFAGAAQLAVMQLIGEGASPIVIVLTAWVINLRFMMYSASIAPYFKGLPVRVRMLLAQILTDQAYAVSISRYRLEKTVQHAWYFFGAAAVMWLVWQIASLTGILVGAQIPAAWGLDIAIPLTFMALLIPALRDKPSLVAALVSGCTAVAAKGLPYNAGLLMAAVLGIAVGVLAERWLKGRAV